MENLDEWADLIARNCQRWLIEHVRQCDDPACREPANLIAYIAHRVGVRVEGIAAVRDELAGYEAKCVNCQHVRN